MSATPSTQCSTQLTLQERQARARAKAAAEGLVAERIGANRYAVPSLHLAPGSTHVVQTTVQSDLAGRVLYGPGHCEGCPGWLYHGYCHHAGAVLNAMDAEVDEAWDEGTALVPGDGDAPIPFPTRAYSDADRFELTAKGAAYLDSLQVPTPAA